MVPSPLLSEAVCQGITFDLAAGAELDSEVDALGALGAAAH